MAAEKEYEKLAEIFQALNNPVRLKILDVLVANCTCSKDGCCVSDINKKVSLPQPYISKHLKVLKDCGLLSFKKEANKIYYSFNNVEVIDRLIDYLGKCRKCC